MSIRVETKKNINSNRAIQHLIENKLKEVRKLWNTEQTELNQTLLFDLIEKTDEKVIGLLLQEKELRDKFFIKVEDVHVFKINDFRFFLEENQINNSFTDYKNRIGLTDGKRFLRDTKDVVLDFPYKDCVLEGDQSTEEGKDTYFEHSEKSKSYVEKQSKREEIFFNTILAHHEIDRLFDNKALVNWRRYSKDEEGEVKEIKRGSRGIIRENLIIKGNNLLALYSLKKQFARKIKMIYIDPPYNTGKDSFSYNDRFKRSTWLTFMKNRLEAARGLLRENGSIFVQCDDKELAYLKVLMDEIFGGENFVCEIVRKVSSSPRIDAKHISISTDKILFYAKNISRLRINREKYELKGYDQTDKHLENRGKYKLNKMDRGSIRYSSSMDYPIEAPDKTLIYPGGTSEKTNWCWRWSQKKVKWGLEYDYIEFKKVKDKWSVYYKTYEFVDNELKRIERRTIPYKNLLLDFYNEKGTAEHKKLFGEKLFSNPKLLICHFTSIHI